MKFFNTAGPVNPEKHYCVPLATRLNELELHQLVEQEKYFILHAPRQTGKTSAILNFVKELNKENKYIALYVNVESAQALRGNIEQALPVIIQELKTQAMMALPLSDSIFEAFRYLKQEHVPAGSLLTTFFNIWCTNAQKPIILFIDEIDSLIGDTLI